MDPAIKVAGVAQKKGLLCTELHYRYAVLSRESVCAPSRDHQPYAMGLQYR